MFRPKSIWWNQRSRIHGIAQPVFVYHEHLRVYHLLAVAKRQQKAS